MLSINAINYTISHLLKVALATTDSFDFTTFIDNEKNSIQINLYGKIIIFQLSSIENIDRIIKGDSIFKTIHSADKKIEIPVIIDHEKPFASFNNEILIIHADIVTLSFCMLSRLEECVADRFDEHGNFDFAQSICSTYNIIDFPIVDEYALILRKYLSTYLSLNLVSEHKCQIIPTHDIDHVRRFDGFFTSAITIIGGDLLARKNLKFAINSFHHYINSIKKPFLDPMITAANSLLELSYELGLKSTFYFMCSNKSKYDEGYDIYNPAVQALIKKIKQRDMNIGYHASYNTFCDSNLFREEKQNLEKAIGHEILVSRQHYLHFNINKTPVIWEDNQIITDSTLGFNSREGFRCGTCHEFNLYDRINDRETSVIELPLLVMDCTLLYKRHLTVEQAYTQLEKLYDRCCAVNGKFVILWHSHFMHREWEVWYQDVYKKILYNKC